MTYRASGQLLFTSEVYDGVVRVAASVKLRDSHTTTHHMSMAGLGRDGKVAAGSLRFTQQHAAHAREGSSAQ